MSHELYLFESNHNITNEGNGLNNASCPLNEFCSSEALRYCRDTPLLNCVHCDQNAAYGYAIALSFLGILILFGNILILLVFIKRSRKGNLQKVDPIKMSLAIADILTGIQIFVIILPNVLWKLTVTAKENFQHRLDSKENDSPECGAMLILTFSASLYHLIVLAAQRLFALLRPYSYKGRSMTGIYVTLTVVWIFSGLTAAVPGLFPQYYRYCTKSNLCFVCSSSVIAHLLLYSVFLFLPFFVMTVTSITTGFVARKKLLHSSTLHGAGVNKDRAIRFNQRQFAVFKTVVIMQIGFTLALGPTIVCLALVFVGLFECDIAEVLETVCFTLYFTNSLVNVIVYSAREKNFRSDVVNLCSIVKPKRQKDSQENFPRQMQERNLENDITRKNRRPTATTNATYVKPSILINTSYSNLRLKA